MGIKYFFAWLKETFKASIQTVTINDRTFAKRAAVDTLLIDMNGVYHYCAQKIFQYGNYERKEEERPKPTPANCRRMYRAIGDYLDRLFEFVQPRQRIILAVDGSAPLAKQAQQRSRRFRSAVDRNDGEFDSTAITPGTELMDHLTRYIDWWIRRSLSEGKWNGVEVVFSSEKMPGEGEHKLVEWVRRYGTDQERYMLYGMDADLVMLALATHRPHFQILRDDPRREWNYFHIDLEAIRDHLVAALLAEHTEIEDRVHIIDFVAMVAFTGNDFLPHLPTIEILGGGLQNLLATYRSVSKQYGSLTTQAGTLSLPALQVFLGTLGLSQTSDLIAMHRTPIEFPDTLLARFVTHSRDEWKLDEEGYRTAYYAEKMDCHTEEEVMIACMKYIDGLQWVLTYYTRGTPYAHWRWFYPYHHAPFLTDLAKYANRYHEWSDLRPRKDSVKALKAVKGSKGSKSEKIPDIVKSAINPYSIRSPDNRPFPPLLQLLSVLPPKGSALLPGPIAALMRSEELKPYYPDEFKVDMDGKRRDYEGVAILPVLDYGMLEERYQHVTAGLDEKDLRLNRRISAFRYRPGAAPYRFVSFYGDLDRCVVSLAQVEM